MRSQLPVLGLGALLATAAHAQQPATDSPSDAESSEIIVTGTRVQDRTRLDTVSPVDVLTSTELANQGTTELAEALSTLAPSVNFPRPAVTDGTDHIRPITLRGLSPDQTLVLVNSKRRHQSALVNVNGSVGRGSAAVDLNAIPMAAIERVEVLRDGASAQYGSDAIAGVVNIRLREARSGGAASVTYGQYDTEVETARTRYDKSDGGTATASTWAGFGIGQAGFLTLSAEYRDRDPTSRGDLDPRLGTQTPPEPLRVNSRYGDAEVQDITVYANAGLPLEMGWDLYGWAGFQKREGDAAATPRIRSNPNNDINLYPTGFLPIITSDIKDIAAGFGIKGELLGWDADTSIVYGRNDFDYGVEETLNGSLVPNSPTSFDAGGLAYDQLVFNFGLVRGFEWGLAGPANLAIGVEARRETYEITAGEPNSYITASPRPAGSAGGAQGFPGFQPSNEVDEDRTAVGVYAEVEVPVTERFLGSVAVRAEDYSDFGSNVTGKISGRFDFTNEFAVRGTVARGFRAPGLQQEFFTATSTIFVGGVATETGAFPATSEVARALGAQDLEAEESMNYSLGFVLRLGGLEATVDAYRIDIDDRIILSENLSGPSVTPIIAPFGVAAARFFMNGVDTRTEGVDVVLRQAFVIGDANKLSVTASANFNDTEVTRLPTSNLIAVPLFDLANRIILEQTAPDNKFALALDWLQPVGFGELSVGLKATRYGKMTDPGTFADGRDEFELDAKTLLDFDVGAKFGEHLSATLGVDNVLDEYPDATPAAFNTNGLLGFSRYSPFGFNGRFLYARLGYNW